MDYYSPYESTTAHIRSSSPRQTSLIQHSKSHSNTCNAANSSLPTSFPLPSLSGYPNTSQKSIRMQFITLATLATLFAAAAPAFGAALPEPETNELEARAGRTVAFNVAPTGTGKLHS